MIFKNENVEGFDLSLSPFINSSKLLSPPDLPFLLLVIDSTVVIVGASDRRNQVNPTKFPVIRPLVDLRRHLANRVQEERV